MNTTEISQLVRLLNALNALQDTATDDTGQPGQNLIGQTVIVRSNTSGVSAGTLTGLDLVTKTVILDSAIRIWSWSDAFTLSEVATNGAQCRTAWHPDGVLITDSGLEILPMTDNAWQAVIDQMTVGAQ